MKRFYIILILLLYSCDIESPIEDNFVVEAFLFQGEKVDDIKIKKAELWNSLDSLDTYISDAEIINDVLIVTGLFGGIDFYDISNPEQLNHLRNFLGFKKNERIVSSTGKSSIVIEDGELILNKSDTKCINFLSDN